LLLPNRVLPPAAIITHPNVMQFPLFVQRFVKISITSRRQLRQPSWEFAEIDIFIKE